MKHIWILFVFVQSFVFAQSKIYRGERVNSSELVYTITQNSIQKMSSAVWGKEVYFIQGNRVYDDSFRSNCVYTLEGNKIYRGNSNSVFDLLYEFENDKFYQVSNSALRKCMYTLSNNQIFIGDSQSIFDCVFTVEIDPKINSSALLLFLCIAPY